LNVESGLNDGIATPFVSLFIALAVAPNVGHDGGWLLAALKEIGIACLVGIGIGLVGGTILTAASKRAWTSEASEELATLAFALAAFFGAASLGGNGFIAAFIGGVAYGAMTRGLPDAIAAYTQTTGTFLSIWVWTVFGAAFVPLAFKDHVDWRAILYALLSLTVIRMVPVAIALRGERLRRDTVLLMGWFGPRGLASIVFLLTAFLALEKAHKPVDTLVVAATWTIFLSVLVHGVSAGPLAGWYARRLQAGGAELAEVQETADVTALRRRL
jgi:NhaP-type Na+/H+ or K+/H+ antiporter